MTEAETEPGYPAPDTSNYDFGGQTVHFIAPEWSNYTYYYTEELDGEAVNDAAFNRLSNVKNALNVEIEWVWSTDANTHTDVRKTITAGDDAYDIVFTHSVYGLNDYASTHSLYNLDVLPNVDFNAPWWSRSMMDDFRIGSETYYAYGDIILSANRCVFFNKSIANDNDMPDHYQMVRDGKWTYDVFLSEAKSISNDVNGDGKADADDIYGFFNRGMQTVNYVSMSTGYRYLQRDKDNLPVLDLNNEDGIRWSDYMYRMLYEDNMSLTDAKQDGLVHFASGKSLFFLGMLSEYIKDEVRGMAEYYGVPEKMAEIQSWYDGYDFAGTEIYNPWSVLNYFKQNCRAAPYWLDTSSNDLITEIVATYPHDTKKVVAQLLRGERVYVPMAAELGPYAFVKDNPDTLYALLVSAGYLKVSSEVELGCCAVEIPNHEIRQVFERDILTKLRRNVPDMDDITSASSWRSGKSVGELPTGLGGDCAIGRSERARCPFPYEHVPVGCFSTDCA